MGASSIDGLARLVKVTATIGKITGTSSADGYIAVMPMDLPPLDAVSAPTDPQRQQRPYLRKAFRFLLLAAYLLALAIVVTLVGRILSMP